MYKQLKTDSLSEPKQSPTFRGNRYENKERLAIEDGSAKNPRRQPRRNSNRATPADGEIPLHVWDLAKPKTSTEISNTKMASEDKPKTVLPPKMVQQEASKGII